MAALIGTETKSRMKLITFPEVTVVVAEHSYPLNERCLLCAPCKARDASNSWPVLVFPLDPASLAAAQERVAMAIHYAPGGDEITGWKSKLAAARAAMSALHPALAGRKGKT